MSEMVEKPIIKISERDRVNGLPVPNGWHRASWGDWWVPPGGPWWPSTDLNNNSI